MSLPDYLLVYLLCSYTYSRQTTYLTLSNNNIDISIFSIQYIGDSLARQNGMKFSTKDQDNDINIHDSCARVFVGAWWYQVCHQSNLNGQYLNGTHSSYADGIEWETWTGYRYSLKSTKMMIRRK